MKNIFILPKDCLKILIVTFSLILIMSGLIIDLFEPGLKILCAEIIRHKNP